MERHSFRIVSGESLCAFSQNFHTRKLGKITAFYAVHFTGIHRVYVPKKTNQFFFNNKDIVSFMESCCGKGTAIENEAIRGDEKAKQ